MYLIEKSGEYAQRNPPFKLLASHCNETQLQYNLSPVELLVNFQGVD